MKPPRRNGQLRLFLFLLLAVGAGSVCQAHVSGIAPGQAAQRGEQGVLENADVIKLLGSNLSQAAIIEIVRTSRSRFDVGLAGIAALINANVPDAVIKAMVEAAAASARPRQEADRPAVEAPPPVIERTRPAEPQPDAPRRRSFSVVNLKFGGGASTIAVGDVKTHNKSYNDYRAAYASKSGYPVDGRVETPLYLVNGSLDVVLRFTRLVGLGVGAGYLRTSKTSVVDQTFSTGHGVEHITRTLSAIPVRFVPYLFIPLSSGVEVYVSAGTAFYIATVTGTNTYSRSDSRGGSYQYETGSTLDVKKNAPGFEGAAGVKFNLGSTMGFFVEVAGRYAKLGSWKGHYSYHHSDGTTRSYDATLTSYESFDSYTNLWTQFVNLPSSPLTNTSTRRNVRDAQVDFSGVGMTLGAIIRF